MIVILRPPGRGNWAPLTIKVSGRRLAPVDLYVGQRVVLGGYEWRISKVVPS